NHLIGIARDAKGDHLLVDGKPRFQAKEVIAFYPAPTGGRIAAGLRPTQPKKTKRQFVLVDRKPAEATLFRNLQPVSFRPAGKRYAAVCGRSGAQWMVIDGKKGQEYQSIGENLAQLSMGPTFSPDSSKIAYTATANGKTFIVMNDDESDGYDGVALF